jgi:hypothetical protein
MFGNSGTSPNGTERINERQDSIVRYLENNGGECSKSELLASLDYNNVHTLDDIRMLVAKNVISEDHGDMENMNIMLRLNQGRSSDD